MNACRIERSVNLRQSTKWQRRQARQDVDSVSLILSPSIFNKWHTRNIRGENSRAVHKTLSKSYVAEARCNTKERNAWYTRTYVYNVIVILLMHAKCHRRSLFLFGFSSIWIEYSHVTREGGNRNPTWRKWKKLY